MKPNQFYVVVALGALSLILSLLVIAFGQSNQRLQMQAQQQQADINKGSQTQQIGTNIVRDLAQLSVKNESIKQMLAKNGFNVSVNASPSPSDESSSASPTASPRLSPAK